MFVHFWVKGFGPIRPSSVPVVVFIWMHCNEHITFGQFLQRHIGDARHWYKDYHRDTRRSNRTEPFDSEVHKHVLWALWRGRLGARSPTWSCGHVAHPQKVTKSHTNRFLASTLYIVLLRENSRYYQKSQNCIFRILLEKKSKFRAPSVKIWWVFAALIACKDWQIFI